MPGASLCRISGKNQDLWGLFGNPVAVFTCQNASEINKTLSEYEDFLRKNSCYGTGFISYESAEAFDSAMKTKASGGFPLLYLAAYTQALALYHVLPESEAELKTGLWTCEIPHLEYLKQIKTIKDYIAAGDIYQANFTFRMLSEVKMDAAELFLHLAKTHPAPYMGFINTETLKLISLSPELFLRRKGSVLSSEPMKGTAPRHKNSEEDRAEAEKLHHDLKNRAENLMITDMVRNDIGRIAMPGSVKTSRLFEIKSFASVHQMVSTVEGCLPDKCRLPEIMTACFPPASITGAPKIRAMEIIKETESSPRKAYTGSIMSFSPDGDFIFNVAIRTIIEQNGVLELGVGSGIVADSQAESEYEECLLKSSFAQPERRMFRLLESMLVEDGEIPHLDLHLKRLMKSAEIFERKLNTATLKPNLKQLAEQSGKNGRYKLRLTIAPNGDIETELMALKAHGWGKEILKCILSSHRINHESEMQFLRNKTTERKLYDKEFHAALASGFDEVIFINKSGELTEGAISNLFILHNGRWKTPALTCGLLPGIWRSAMLKELDAEECSITLNDLAEAEKMTIGNSIRGSGAVYSLSIPDGRVLNFK